MIDIKGFPPAGATIVAIPALALKPQVISMRNLLLAVDGSDHALEAARHVATRARQGEVFALHVVTVQSRPRPHAGLMKIVSQAMIDEHAREQGATAMRRALSALDAGGVRYQADTLFGEAPRAIAERAHELGCSEIVMGTRGHSALASFVLGSVATRVIQLATMPVTLVSLPFASVHSTESDTMTPLDHAPVTLLAIDGSDHADRATAFVIDLHSRCEGRCLHVLNVQLPYPTGGVWSEIAPEALRAAHEEEGHLALRHALALLTGAGVHHTSEVTVGAPGEAIVASARHHSCDRIVLGTRGLGEARNLFLGSVAQKVVHLAQVPVTLVK